MQTGKLNQFIEVQRKQSVIKNDGSGDRETVWTTIFPIYGHITDASIRDFIAARKDQKVIATRIVLRQDDIEPNTDWSLCRLLCDGLYYRIIAPLRDNKTGREYVTLACELGAYVWQDSK
ncbi:head-tail adaptor protein [Acinetobacter sp. SwsAc3]|nr:head-tail adaptor protein [Acinetobacter sp. SwsAc3]